MTTLNLLSLLVVVICSFDSWTVAERNIPHSLEIESLVIDGLSENREYHVRIRANNLLGSSEPSIYYVAYTPSVSGKCCVISHVMMQQLHLDVNNRCKLIAV